MPTPTPTPTPNDDARTLPLRVLLLEDTRYDVDLLREILLRAYPQITLDVVGDEDAFIEQIAQSRYDIILSDYRLPGFTGADAMRAARVGAAGTPFIFVSGVIGEENAVELLKQGATDYVSKSRLGRLPVVMARALREVADRQGRESAEVQLREVNALFARVVDSLRDYAVILLDPQGIIKTWNRAAGAVFGYPEGAGPVGVSGSILATPDDRADLVFEGKLRISLAHGRADTSGWMARADGSRFWAEGVMTPLHDEAGLHSGYSKIVRDATDAHRDAELLRVAKDAAERANQAKDRFLAVMSHELRTPLASISAAAHVLERYAVVPDKFGTLLPMIKRNVALEARLIDDMLDLTSITAGKVSLHLAGVDMHRLVRETAEMIGHDIRAKHIGLSLELMPQPALVCADEVRMQQVLANVFRNAVKFTPEGGSIRIATALRDGRFVLTCADSGIGIEVEALQRIFIAFEQADGDISKRFGGLGLGLAIAAGLVNQHGGSLTASSDGRDRGATFTLDMPAGNVDRDDHAADDGSDEPPPVSTSPCDLLLVEDNVDAADTMAMSLEAYGYRVSRAATQAEALEVIEARRFDVVVTDIGLPDGSGIEVGRALKGTAPVIALSGYGSAADIERSMRAGFSLHLVKPVGPDELHGAVQGVLARRAAA